MFAVQLLVLNELASGKPTQIYTVPECAVSFARWHPRTVSAALEQRNSSNVI